MATALSSSRGRQLGLAPGAWVAAARLSGLDGAGIELVGLAEGAFRPARTGAPQSRLAPDDAVLVGGGWAGRTLGGVPESASAWQSETGDGPAERVRTGRRRFDTRQPRILKTGAAVQAAEHQPKMPEENSGRGPGAYVTGAARTTTYFTIGAKCPGPSPRQAKKGASPFCLCSGPSFQGRRRAPPRTSGLRRRTSDRQQAQGIQAGHAGGPAGILARMMSWLQAPASWSLVLPVLGTAVGHAVEEDLGVGQGVTSVGVVATAQLLRAGGQVVVVEVSHRGDLDRPLRRRCRNSTRLKLWLNRVCTAGDHADGVRRADRWARHRWPRPAAARSRRKETAAGGPFVDVGDAIFRPDRPAEPGDVDQRSPSGELMSPHGQGVGFGRERLAIRAGGGEGQGQPF